MRLPVLESILPPITEGVVNFFKEFRTSCHLETWAGSRFAIPPLTAWGLGRCKLISWLSLLLLHRYSTTRVLFPIEYYSIWGYYGTQYRVRLYPPFGYSILYKEYNLTRFNHQKNTTLVLMLEEILLYLQCSTLGVG